MSSSKTIDCAKKKTAQSEVPDWLKELSNDKTGGAEQVFTRGVLGWWPGCLASSIASMGFRMFPEFFDIEINQMSICIPYMDGMGMGYVPSWEGVHIPSLGGIFESLVIFFLLFPFGGICLFQGG